MTGAEVILSAPAKLGARVHGLAPATVVALLALVARLLPRTATPRTVEGAEIEPHMHSRAFRAATVLGRRGGRALRETP